MEEDCGEETVVMGQEGSGLECYEYMWSPAKQLMIHTQVNCFGCKIFLLLKGYLF